MKIQIRIWKKNNNYPLGWYVYMETSGKEINSTADLISPTINFATTRDGSDLVCVRFYYHMYGKHVDTLSVFRTDSGSTKSTLLWTKKGTRPDAWTYGQITVNRIPSFQV